MRLNTEQDRVNKYKAVALNDTKRYYNLLEKFTKIIDSRKEVKIVTQTPVDTASKNGTSNSEENQSSKNEELDF